MLGYAVAAIVAAVVATVASALSVGAYFRASREARRLRSINSTLAELHEIRDYVQKIDAWSKRINSRLAMEARRSPPAVSDSGQLDLNQITDKAELRRRIGLVPGKPAPHRG